MKKQNWLILGAGLSGQGAAELLRARYPQARLTVVCNFVPPLSAEEIFHELGAQILPGQDCNLSLLESDPAEPWSGLIVSPGVLPHHPLVDHARALGIEVLSEVTLATRHYSGHLIGVTGTNGKSTTTAMIAHILSRCGLGVAAAGNIGIPLSRLLARGDPPEVVALELSSYQLADAPEFSLDGAVWTSFTPDHMEYHQTLENYFLAKANIILALKKKNGGSSLTASFHVLASQRAAGFPAPWSRPLDEFRSGPDGANTPTFRLRVVTRKTARNLVPDWLGIKTEHDRLNAGMALDACAAYLGLNNPGVLIPKLAGFASLPHRCQNVGWVQGQPVINDSKATNVAATLVALAAQKDPVALFCGGQAKKSDRFLGIVTSAHHIKTLIVFGEAAPTILAEIGTELQNIGIEVRAYPRLASAFADLDPHAAPWGRAGILFSPGCASTDEFTNFEERGTAFSTWIKPHLDPGESPSSQHPPVSHP